MLLTPLNIANSDICCRSQYPKCFFNRARLPYWVAMVLLSISGLSNSNLASAANSVIANNDSSLLRSQSSFSTVDNLSSYQRGSHLGNFYNNSSAYTQNSPSAITGFNEDPSFSLPDLGSNGSRFIEANKHRAVGEWSLQQIGKSAPLLNDPWSQEQLETLTWKINAQARTQAPLALTVINNASINAFAIPGGVMGIHTGTVIEANNMDEVASVIAHEVAHLSQRHHENRGDASRKALLLQIGGLLAGIAASAVDGDAGAAVMMGSQTAAMNSQMAFSRSNEREADRIGMQLMAKSGFDPRAMPKFFGTLNQKTQLNMADNAYLPSFIMTHPLSSERLSEAQSRANSYPIVGLSGQRSQLTFELLKWRLKVLTNQTIEAELLAAATKSKGAELALAYWYATQNRYNDATQRLNKIKKSTAQIPSADKMAFSILTAITEGQIAGRQGNWQQTEKVLTPYYNLYPERRDIKLLMADAWLYLGKYNKVIGSIKPIVERRPHDLEALYRMQRAYELMATQQLDAVKTTSTTSATGSNPNLMRDIASINALRYRAKGELWQGRYSDALVSLHQAKKQAEQLQSATTKTVINVRPILANINSEIAEVKTAKEFRA